MAYQLITGAVSCSLAPSKGSHYTGSFVKLLITGDAGDSETKIDRIWIIQLALLKKAWERGDKDIYAMKRLSPEPEFVLTNKHSYVLCKRMEQ